VTDWPKRVLIGSLLGAVIGVLIGLDMGVWLGGLDHTSWILEFQLARK